MNFLNTVAKNYEYFDKFKLLIFKLWRVFMWQMYTQLFASSYIWLAYVFEASYSTVVMLVSKKSARN